MPVEGLWQELCELLPCVRLLARCADRVALAFGVLDVRSFDLLKEDKRNLNFAQGAGDHIQEKDSKGG
jgi:hypothetical protein